jgi:hypothetical protein
MYVRNLSYRTILADNSWNNFRSILSNHYLSSLRMSKEEPFLNIHCVAWLYACVPEPTRWQQVKWSMFVLRTDIWQPRTRCFRFEATQPSPYDCYKRRRLRNAALTNWDLRDQWPDVSGTEVQALVLVKFSPSPRGSIGVSCWGNQIRIEMFSQK